MGNAITHRKPKETPSKEDADDSDVDWALEYHAFLEGKEKVDVDESDKGDKDESEQADTEEEGEEWAKEYATYCCEKEEEFFDKNKPKE